MHEYWKFPLFVMICAPLLAGPPALASLTRPPLPPRGLVEEADIIFEGRVLDVRYVQFDELPVTRVVVSDLVVHKGQVVESAIEIGFPGGTTQDGTFLGVEGVPALWPEDWVFVFGTVVRGGPGERVRPVDWAGGVILASTDLGGRDVLTDGRGRVIASASPDAWTYEAQAEPAVSLDTCERSAIPSAAPESSLAEEDPLTLPALRTLTAHIMAQADGAAGTTAQGVRR